MGKKRVFILGAGFSKQAGMPLGTELTSLILNSTTLVGLEEMQGWVSGLKERVALLQEGATSSAHFLLNIEQLFEFARYDEELWRMRQQEELVGRTSGQTSWCQAEAISNWLKYVEDELVHVICNAQENANTVDVERFVDHLADDDAIITFNYDTLVETALTKKGRAWNHGLADSANGGVAVLKMHGSVDWFILERKGVDRLQGFTKLFSKTDVNVEKHGAMKPMKEVDYAHELWRADGIDEQRSMLKNLAGVSTFNVWPGLAGLGSHKPLHPLPGSARTWVEAFDALREADELCIIGFSMSPYDTMTRFHFASVLRERKLPPKRRIVVDPNATVLAENFSAVLGRPLMLVADPAQNVDWAKLLP